jgi:hypothetical protein
MSDLCLKAELIGVVGGEDNRAFAISYVQGACKRVPLKRNDYFPRYTHP